MRRFAIGLAAAVCGLFACAAAQAASLSAVQTITAGGHQRTFYYYKPDTFDPSKGMVVWLHGGGGNALSGSAGGSDNLWRLLADRVGVLVLFPDGKSSTNDPDSRTWNNCSDDIATQLAAYDDWDDVSFLRALIPWATSNISGSIDTTRVYMAGHSEGAKMAERMALEANDVVAAVGVVAGNLPVANDNGASYKCGGYTAAWTAGTAQAVPVFLFKGDADPRILYGDTANVDHDVYCQIKDPNFDGQPNPQTCRTGRQHSYYDTVAFWQWKLGISLAADTQAAPTSTTPYADTVPSCTSGVVNCDGSQVTRYTYGAAPYRLVFDRATGAGHAMPGPDQQTQASLTQNGRKNRDALGQAYPYVAEEMWAFFTQFTLSD